MGDEEMVDSDKNDLCRRENCSYSPLLYYFVLQLFFIDTYNIMQPFSEIL